MSSTPDQVFSDLNETKDYLNIARSNDDSNEKINTARNAADNYTANQIRLHATIPLTDADPELTSLSSQLAAAYFNQFQNPMKAEMLELVKAVKQSVQDYIMETYGLKNPSGLSGEDTFGITKAFTGFTREAPSSTQVIQDVDSIPQTPWLSDIDAATFSLFNLGTLTFNNTGAGTDPFLASNSSENTLLLTGNLELASYIDMAEGGVPSAPATDTGRIFVDDDTGTTALFFEDSTGTITNLIAGQTPWLSDIDADGNNLNNLINLDVSTITNLSTISGTLNNNVFEFTDIVNAVNNIRIQNGQTGQAVKIISTGNDANIDLDLEAKGSGSITRGTFPLDGELFTSTTNFMFQRTTAFPLNFNMKSLKKDASALVSFNFVGLNSADEETVYGQLSCNIVTATDGIEDSKWAGRVIFNGDDAFEIFSLNEISTGEFFIQTNITFNNLTSGDVADYPILQSNSSFQTLSLTGNLTVSKRIQGSKGANVTSAATITLGDGNFFDVTGVIGINSISSSGWQAGSQVTLRFDSSLTITSGLLADNITLINAGTFIVSADDTLTVIYDGTVWQEISRGT